MHGTWTTNGGAAPLTAGGVLAVIGAVAVIADWGGIAGVIGELAAVLALAVLGAGVLAVAGLVALGMWFRRDEQRFAAHLAERRAAAQAAILPVATRIVPARPVTALPVAQPQVVHYHLHGPDAAQTFPQAVSRGTGKPQIAHYQAPGEEVPR